MVIPGRGLSPASPESIITVKARFAPSAVMDSAQSLRGFRK